MTFAEVISFNFDMLWSDDVTPVIPYAKLAVGQKGKTWRAIVGGQNVYDKTTIQYYNRRWSDHVGRPNRWPEHPFFDQLFNTYAVYKANG